jgi:hypothetical protein
MNDQELRITSAHAGGEFKGAVWGIDVALFPWVALGLLAGLGLFVGLFYGAGWDFPEALQWAVLPVALIILYLRLAHQGKPPGFTLELLDQLVTGGHASPPPQSPRHPFDHE